MDSCCGEELQHSSKQCVGPVHWCNHRQLMDWTINKYNEEEKLNIYIYIFKTCCSETPLDTPPSHIHVQLDVLSVWECDDDRLQKKEIREMREWERERERERERGGGDLGKETEEFSRLPLNAANGNVPLHPLHLNHSDVYLIRYLAKKKNLHSKKNSHMQHSYVVMATNITHIIVVLPYLLASVDLAARFPFLAGKLHLGLNCLPAATTTQSSEAWNSIVGAVTTELGN